MAEQTLLTGYKVLDFTHALDRAQHKEALIVEIERLVTSVPGPGHGPGGVGEKARPGSARADDSRGLAPAAFPGAGRGAVGGGSSVRHATAARLSLSFLGQARVASPDCS